MYQICLSLFNVVRIKGSPRCIYRIAVYYLTVDVAPEITVLQLPKFKAEATKLIGADGIEAVAVYLIKHPDAGDVIQGVGGARKLRWAARASAAAHGSFTSRW